MVKLFNKEPNFETIHFTKPIKGKDGKYFVAMNSQESDESNEIICQFGPKLKISSDVQESDTSIDVLIVQEEIIDFIKDCDDNALAFCKDNKEAWFEDEDISDSYIDQAFMSSIKEMKKQKGSYGMKMRISRDIDVFNGNKENMEKENIKKDAKVSMIVQMAGLWFTKTRFGLTWKVMQVKLNEDKEKKIGKSMFFEEYNEHDIDNVFPDE